MTRRLESAAVPLFAQLESDGAIAVVMQSQTASTLSLEILADGAAVAVLRADELPRLGAEAVNRVIEAPDTPCFTSWRIADAQASRSCDADILPEWTISGGHTAYMHTFLSQDEVEQHAIYSCPVEGERLSASPHEVYGFSALVGLHRTTGRLRLSFFGPDGLLERHQTEAPQGFRGGQQRDGYALVEVTAICPDGANSLSIELVKAPTQEGQDSFLFFTEPRVWRGQSGLKRRPVDLPHELAITLFSLADAELRLIPLHYTTVDRLPSELDILDHASGELLSRLKIAAVPGAPFELEILGLEGTAILVRVTRVAAWCIDVDVALWADGRPLGQQTLHAPCVGDHFRITVPSEVFDACAHLFQLKLANSGRLLAECAGFVPDNLLHWDDLIRHRARPLTIARSPAAEHRYRALAKATERLLRTPRETSAEQALLQIQSVAQAHTILEAGFDPVIDDYPELSFTLPPQPRISIVIPVHNNFAVTMNCVAAIIVTGANLDAEIIVVDDGSSDRTIEISNILPQVVYVRNEVALGFVGACNRGAELASGEFIVFLNNDTEPTSGWLDELMFAFAEFQDIGLAGSMLVYPDGRLQDAGGIVWGTGDPWNYGRGGAARDPRYLYSREVDYVSGACMMISRSVWRHIGGFSAEFAPAYFEDTDLAFKVRQIGKRVVFVPTSLVYHYEGLSNGIDVTASTGLKRFQEINRPKFKARWRDSYRDHGRMGENVDLEKDRGICGRAVFFDLDVPKVDQSAGGYAAFQEIRLFQSLGYKVTFVPMSMNYLGKYTEQLQRCGVEVIYAPHFSSVEDFIRRRGGEFDLAYITRYQVSARVADAFRSAAPGAPVICNVADLHFLRALRQATLHNNHMSDLQAVAELRDIELGALSKVDLALTYSEIEESVLSSHLLGRVKVGRLPWVLETTETPATLHDRTGIGFIGGFGHAPNVAAVEYFLGVIMPLVRRRMPGVCFHVYGSNLPPHLAALGTEDVVFEGFVADLREIFDRRRIFVAPLTYGAGIKGKVLDCAAAGVPTVLSPTAAEGLPIRHGLEALVANGPEAWVEALVLLYTDDDIWRKLSCAALEMASSQFSFERGRQTLADALSLVGVSAQGHRRALQSRHSRPEDPGSR